MVGCVGRDARAHFLLDGLDAEGIDRTFVSHVDAPTGVALITVDPEDVSIVVVSGANAALSEQHVMEASGVIAEADVLLLQGESPAATALAAARVARANDTTVVFNPAPVNDVADVVMPLADVVTVNRHESELLGPQISASPVKILVTTLGSEGCEVTVDGQAVDIAPLAANVVDPTGAGDSFAAAFAVRYAETGDALLAARFAAAAGACTVEGRGAQPSLPTRSVVNERLA
jgi:ribokinase